MKSTQVTTWRRYTTAEKKAYQARVRRRMNGSWVTRQAQIQHIARIFGVTPEELVSTLACDNAERIRARRFLIISGMGN